MGKYDLMQVTSNSSSPEPRVVARLVQGHLRASIEEYDFEEGPKKVVVLQKAKYGRPAVSCFEEHDLPLLVELVREVMETLSKGVPTETSVS